MSARRPVISGLGILAANGTGKEAFWRSLLEGRSGVGPITLCEAGGLSSRVAGEVKDFDPDRYLDGRVRAKRITRTVQLGVAASRLALEDAGLSRADLLRAPPLAIELGVSMSGFDFIEREIRRIAQRGITHMHPSVVGCIAIAAAATVADVLAVPTRISTLSNSCVGGLDALASAAGRVRAGEVDIALAGATDAPVVTCLASGFCAAGMLSTWQGEPHRASRPFDLHHERGVLAEGSAVAVVETYAHARARGAVPYAEILGYGSASDPDPEAGSGLRNSMRLALADAALVGGDLSHIAAHGPSDVEVDRAEVAAIKKVLGRGAYRIPVSSIKGATGNPLAAGAVMQVVAACLAFREGCLPPTVNLETPDPLCDLDFVTGAPRRAEPGRILVNSHGSGRVNSSMVLGRLVPR